MGPISRRKFLPVLATGISVSGNIRGALVNAALTVRGPVSPLKLGTTLIHEHILVDFGGADQASPDRYDPEEVFRTALPHLKEVRQRGCDTLVECTPDYLARDAALLKRLSIASGLHLITNTGYYGAAKDKFVPAHAYKETPKQLAARWTEEFRKGIGGTGIRPGFMKIGVDAGPLSEIDRKLVEAAALCHLDTGLRIHVHTGDGTAALAILDVLKAREVEPAAYVWVHAQNEKDRKIHLQAARMGAWLEFDGINQKSMADHLDAVVEMNEADFLHNLLISQDSGWYRAGEPGGGRYNGYTFLFDEFLPALRKRNFSEAQIQMLMVHNPARVLTPGTPQRSG